MVWWTDIDLCNLAFVYCVFQMIMYGVQSSADSRDLGKPTMYTNLDASLSSQGMIADRGIISLGTSATKCPLLCYMCDQ